MAKKKVIKDMIVMPNAVETERELLAQIIMDNDVIDKVMPYLPNHSVFYDNFHANVWKGILEYCWDISDGDEVFKQVIHDYTVTGLGYFYGYVDREADYGRGEVKFTYVDPFRVVVDPNARNRYFDDATGMMLSTIFTKFQLLDLYPQLKELNEDIVKYQLERTRPNLKNPRKHDSPKLRKHGGKITPRVKHRGTGAALKGFGKATYSNRLY